MSIYGLMVTRNEADRYLVSALYSLTRTTDGVLVYDDRSTDRTVPVALRCGARVAIRASGPSFMEHEGQFRQQAWDALTDEFELRDGDWVLSLDADELLWAGREHVEQVIADTITHRQSAAAIRIREVFALDDGQPMIRTDGYWGSITGDRLIAWRSGAQFANKQMACGSAPMYVNGNVFQSDINILHYGYAYATDRTAKYSRYSNHPIGHNTDHIDSILTRPTLVPWTEEPLL